MVRRIHFVYNTSEVVISRSFYKKWMPVRVAYCLSVSYRSLDFVMCFKNVSGSLLRLMVF